MCAVLVLAACAPTKERDGAGIAQLPVAEEKVLETVEGTLRRGETPTGWAVRQGIPVTTAQEIIGALAVHLSAARYRTDDRLQITRDEGGEIVSLAVERMNGERYVARRTGAVWMAARESEPVRREIVHFRGTIRSSLWESLIDAGASPDLVVRFSDIFSWTFDFLTDCREGDQFDLIAESIWQGEQFRRHGDILVARYEGERGTVSGVRFEPEGEKAAYYAPDGASLQKAFLRSPLNYRRISSGFSRSRYHPVLKRYMPHLGIDYAAAAGTPVVTIGEGVVTYAGWKKGFGKFVEVKHSRSYATTYGHLSRFGSGVRSGSRVAQGDVIGYVGSTGLATGPHLDFRMKHGASWVNPLKIEIPSAEPVPASEMTDFLHVARVCLAALDVLPEGDLDGGEDPIAFALLAGPDAGTLPQLAGLEGHPAP
jgi:murein DD-endopeptidase MepM/ murein hydrolase activator NlpD